MTETIAADVETQIQRALARVSFCHRGAPDLPHNKGLLPAWTDAGVTYYEAVSPAATGMSANELQRFFREDMELPPPTFNRKPWEKRDFMARYVPSFEKLPTEDSFEDPTGIQKANREANYCLIARGDAGTVVGFVIFSFRLLPSHESDDPIEGPDYLELVLRLDYAYTCTAYRRKGVFSALATAVQHAYRAELEHISGQPEQVVQWTGEPVELIPSLEAEWVSISGELAYHVLWRTLEDEGKLANEEGEYLNLKIDELEVNASY